MKIAVVFPGQGSQSPGMLDAWAAHDISAPVIAEASEVFGADLAEVCRDPEALARTEVVQPAIFAASVAAFTVLDEAGIEPVAMAGHSLGEYSALVASKTIPFGPTLDLVRKRSIATAAAADATAGAMTAVIGLPPEDAAAICAEAAQGEVLVVANENSPKQTVLSGVPDAIGRAEELVRARGGKATRLPVAGAFHSPLMEPAVAEIEAGIRALIFSPPSVPVVLNGTGEPATDPDDIRERLTRHVTGPVRWVASMTAMAALGAEAFAEAGPGRVLTGLARACTPGIPSTPVGSPDDAAAFVAQAGGG